MATGLYVTPDGKVVVTYGARKLPNPLSQYKANGYKPSCEKLLVMDTTNLDPIPRSSHQNTGARVPNA